MLDALENKAAFAGDRVPQNTMGLAIRVRLAGPTHSSKYPYARGSGSGGKMHRPRVISDVNPAIAQGGGGLPDPQAPRRVQTATPGSDEAITQGLEFSPAKNHGVDTWLGDEGTHQLHESLLRPDF